MSRSRNLKPKTYKFNRNIPPLRFSEKEMNDIYINYLLLLKTYNHNKAEATKKVAKAPLWAIRGTRERAYKKTPFRLWVPLHIKTFFFKLIRSNYAVVGE